MKCARLSSLAPASASRAAQAPARSGSAFPTAAGGVAGKQGGAQMPGSRGSCKAPRGPDLLCQLSLFFQQLVQLPPHGLHQLGSLRGQTAQAPPRCCPGKKTPRARRAGPGSGSPLRRNHPASSPKAQNRGRRGKGRSTAALSLTGRAATRLPRTDVRTGPTTRRRPLLCNLHLRPTRRSRRNSRRPSRVIFPP